MADPSAFPFFSSGFVSFLWKFLLAIIVALPIGIEREKSRKFAGVRTSLMITSVGFFSSFFSGLLFLPWIILAGFVFSTAISIVMYYARSRLERHPGLTTSIVFVLLFWLGVLVDTGYYLEAIASSLVITFLLSAKGLTKRLVAGLTEKEIIDAIVFGILSFVILPLLPNRAVDPFGIFNPFVVWLMIVVSLAIGFVGYASSKAFGKGGSALVTGLVGGLVSSFAVLLSVAPEAKRNRSASSEAALSLSLAFSTTFLRILLIVLLASRPLFDILLFPLLASAGIGFFVSLRDSSRFRNRVQVSSTSAKSPFSFRSALNFAASFAAITIAMRFLSSRFGDAGLYLTALVAGAGGATALVVSVTSLFSSGTISGNSAATSILISLLSSAAVDLTFAAKLGGKKFAFEAGKTIVASSLVCLAFLVGYSLIR